MDTPLPADSPSVPSLPSNRLHWSDPSGALRVLELLNAVELPVLEDGYAGKKLLVSTTIGSWHFSFA